MTMAPSPPSCKRWRCPSSTTRLAKLCTWRQDTTSIYLTSSSVLVGRRADLTAVKETAAGLWWCSARATGASCSAASSRGASAAPSPTSPASTRAFRSSGIGSTRYYNSKLYCSKIVREILPTLKIVILRFYYLNQ